MDFLAIFGSDLRDEDDGIEDVDDDDVDEDAVAKGLGLIGL